MEAFPWMVMFFSVAILALMWGYQLCQAERRISALERVLIGLLHVYDALGTPRGRSDELIAQYFKAARNALFGKDHKE